MSLHPAQVLFAGEKPFPALPAVDHYAGAEKLMLKALKLQQELGPVFDITCDCEDGARAGAVARATAGSGFCGNTTRGPAVASNTSVAAVLVAVGTDLFWATGIFVA